MKKKLQDPGQHTEVGVAGEEIPAGVRVLPSAEVHQTVDYFSKESD